MRVRIIIGVIIFFISVISAYAQEYRLERGVMDLHSNISDGLYPPETTADFFKKEGIKVLIFGDSALRKWEYGLWPLRNLIKKTIQEKSVLRLGADKYLKELESLQNKFPGLLIIPGLEASPFYYWEGSPFSKNFSLNDSYKEFLVIGLGQRDFQDMPIVGNRSLKFNQYQGRQGIKPYQNLIDYVIKKGGIIFWAHPEMESVQKYKGIEVYTPEHPENLFLSYDYTGFGVTFTDKLKITETGGIWDKLLLEYIGGRRNKPVWIIGALHYDGLLRKKADVETIFFIKENSRAGILSALREGRMYARFNSGAQPAVLRKFSAENLGSAVQVIISGSQPSMGAVEIELIRNGRVLKRFQESGEEWEIIEQDTLAASEKKAYYRLKITGSSGLILSNPVFVQK